jgi:hypothetical protein
LPRSRSVSQPYYLLREKPISDRARSPLLAPVGIDL